MATKNRLTITAEGENKVTRPMDEAAKAVLEAAKEFRAAADGIKGASEKKNKEIAKTPRFANAAKAALGGLAKGIGVAAGAAVGLGGIIFTLAKRSADMGDAAFIAADRLGTTTDFLTRTQFAATQAGASIGSVEKGIATLAKNALSGSKTFERWGIQIENTDGTLKSTSELFLTAADRISEMTSPTEQAAAAQELLGRSGRELLPVLREGREGLEEYAARADELGITISQTEAIIANEFNNQLGATKDVLNAVSREAGSVFLPVLTDVFVAVQGEAGKLTKDMRDNRDVLRDHARTGIAAIVRGFGTFLQVGKFVTQGIDGIRIAFKFVGVAGNEAIADILEGFKAALDGGINPLLTRLQDLGVIDFGPIGGSLNELATEMRAAANIAQNDLDEAMQGALARGRAWDEAIDRVESFGNALEQNVGVTERRIRENKDEEVRARSRNVLEIEKEIDAAKRKAQEEERAQKKEERDAERARRQAEREAAREGKRRDRDAKKARNDREREVQEEVDAWATRFETAGQLVRNEVGSAIADVREGTIDAGEAAQRVILNLGKAALDAALDFVIAEGSKRAAIALTEAFGTAAAVTDVGLTKTASLSQINAATGVAAANAISAYAGIPFVGPALGAAAAGAAIGQINATALPFLAFAKGGVVPDLAELGIFGVAPVGDRVPALLEPGEVISAERFQSPAAAAPPAAGPMGAPTFVFNSTYPQRQVDVDLWARRHVAPTLERMGFERRGARRKGR